jgi:peptidylprolyl isomerase
MLRINLLAIFALCAQTLASGQTASVTTAHGYRLLQHTQLAYAPKTKPGETAILSVEVWAGDSLLNTSRKTPTGTYDFYYQGPDAQLEHYPPIFDALAYLGKGDSVSIFQLVDDHMRQFMPPAVRGETEIRFSLVLRDIVSVEARRKADEAAQAYANKVGERVSAQVANYRNGLLNAQLTQTPSGLKIWVEEEGKGAPLKVGEAVQVHYYGCLVEGTMFDNSYRSRQPLAFPAGVGQMIAGFDEGILRLRHGSRAYLFIPPNLGYGEAAQGNIPGNSELVFYVEVL